MSAQSRGSSPFPAVAAAAGDGQRPTVCPVMQVKLLCTLLQATDTAFSVLKL
jgi:hypothetical protein